MAPGPTLAAAQVEDEEVEAGEGGKGGGGLRRL